MAKKNKLGTKGRKETRRADCMHTRRQRDELVVVMVVVVVDFQIWRLTGDSRWEAARSECANDSFGDGGGAHGVTSRHDHKLTNAVPCDMMVGI